MKKLMIIFMLLLLCTSVCFVACDGDESVTYTVSFANTGDGTIPAQVVDQDSTATTPTAPTKDGYRFLGWFTSATGGQEYQFSLKVTQNITLYAQWVQLFTVEFKNGEELYDTKTVASGEAVNKPTEPQKVGYAFIAWTDSTGNEYDFNSAVTADITLYAEWKEQFTVSFENTGDSLIQNQIITDGDKAVKPADPTKNGFSFLGWFTEADGSVEFDFDTAITESITVYAQWKENVFKALLIGTFNNWSTENAIALTLGDGQTTLYSVPVRFDAEQSVKVYTEYGTETHEYGDGAGDAFVLAANTIYTVTFDTDGSIAAIITYDSSSAIFHNTASWQNVYAYMWRGDIENAPYPGIELTLTNNQGTIDTTGYEFVIFSDNNLNITETLTLTDGASFSCDGIYVPPKFIYFYNVDSWENVYVHLTTDETENAPFPGVKLVFATPRERVEIEATGYRRVQFSDGVDQQTAVLLATADREYSCRGLYDSQQWPQTTSMKISFINDLNWAKVFIYAYGGGDPENLELTADEHGVYKYEVEDNKHTHCNFNDGVPKGGKSTQRFRLIDGAVYRGSDSKVRFEFTGLGHEVTNDVYILQIVTGDTSLSIMGSYDGTSLTAWLPNTCTYNFTDLDHLISTLTVYRCAEGTTIDNFNNSVFLQKSVGMTYDSITPQCKYELTWLA